MPPYTRKWETSKEDPSFGGTIASTTCGQSFSQCHPTVASERPVKKILLLVAQLPQLLVASPLVNAILHEKVWISWCMQILHLVAQLPQLLEASPLVNAILREKTETAYMYLEILLFVAKLSQFFWWHNNLNYTRPVLWSMQSSTRKWEAGKENPTFGGKINSTTCGHSHSKCNPT
jgi:hypothetical protein